jgi:hypothetical protein
VRVVVGLLRGIATVFSWALKWKNASSLIIKRIQMDPELEKQMDLIAKKGQKKPKAGKAGIIFDSANHELSKSKKTHEDSSSTEGREPGK